jgi:phage shock protein E
LSIDPWGAAAAAAVAAALVVPRLLRGRRVPESTIEEKIAAGATVVDVRSTEEFRRGAYRAALNIPLQALAGRLGEIRRDRPVVLYCASGMRSASAARLLRQAGYPDVVNAGGLGDMPRHA